MGGGRATDRESKAGWERNWQAESLNGGRRRRRPGAGAGSLRTFQKGGRGEGKDGLSRDETTLDGRALSSRLESNKAPSLSLGACPLLLASPCAPEVVKQQINDT